MSTSEYDESALYSVDDQVLNEDELMQANLEALERLRLIYDHDDPSDVSADIENIKRLTMLENSEWEKRHRNGQV